MVVESTNVANESSSFSSSRPYTLFFIRHGEALHNQIEKLAENTALAESLAHGYDTLQVQLAIEQARKAALMGINDMEDPPLSELGIQEARQVRSTLNQLIEMYNLPIIEEVWVSPLRRAMETAGQIFPECFVLSKEKGLDTTTTTTTTSSIIIPKIRVRKEIEERQTGLKCDSHTTYENIVRRLNLKKLSISFLKLDKKALGGLSSRSSLATTASSTGGGKMSSDSLVSNSSNNKLLSDNSLASIGEEERKVSSSTTIATTETIWEDKFDSGSSTIGGGGAATTALMMETKQLSEMSTNDSASIGEDDITSSTLLPAVPEWEDKLSCIESELDSLSKKKDNQDNVNTDTHRDEIPYGTMKFIEDKDMLRERTKKLFDMLSLTNSRSICLIGHKGYLRELERGPLGQTDAELFRNCEVRVYRLELETTDNTTRDSSNNNSSSGRDVVDAQGRTLLHSAEKVTSSLSLEELQLTRNYD
jgi:broad specificity phosphatase PhoE